MLYEDKAIIEIIGQILIGGFFIVQGVKNAMKPTTVLGRLEDYKCPYPMLIMWIGIAMMFTGGGLLIFNFHTQAGALILLVFTALATAIFQRWWTVDALVRRPYNYLIFFIMYLLWARFCC